MGKEMEGRGHLRALFSWLSSLFTSAVVFICLFFHIYLTRDLQPGRDEVWWNLGWKNVAACVFKHQQAFFLSMFLRHSRFYRFILQAYLPALPFRPAPSSNTPSLSHIYSSYPLAVSHPSRCPFASSCSLRLSPHPAPILVFSSPPFNHPFSFTSDQEPFILILLSHYPLASTLPCSPVQPFSPYPDSSIPLTCLVSKQPPVFL